MRLAKSAHPSAETLRAFGLGRLAAKEHDGIERHIAECDRCCEVLSEVKDDGFVQLARQASSLEPDEGITRSLAPRGNFSSAFGSADAVPDVFQDHPRYKVIERVGAGGMGVVFKAQHRFMNRIVALKVIHPAFMSNRNAVARFQREVRAAAMLNHPSIVTAFDADQAGDLHFLVMEFIDGISLAKLVGKKGPLPIGQACHFVRQAALGLQHAHLQGMVHRDIKPHNLMVTRKGQVKLLDMGLARLIDGCDRTTESDDDFDFHRNVQTGGSDWRRLPFLSRGSGSNVVLGTPDYLAPEQAEDSRTVDIRADLYSLGCTLYFLLSGWVPFPDGTVVERLRKHKYKEPTPIELLRPDLPAEVARIVRKLMAKSPEDRYQTPAELAAELAPWATLDPLALQIDHEVDARRPETASAGPSESEPKPERRRVRRVVRRRQADRELTTVLRWIALAIIFQVLLFGFAAFRSYWRRRQPEPDRQELKLPAPSTADPTGHAD